MSTVYFNGFEWFSFYENIHSWDGFSIDIVSQTDKLRNIGTTTVPRSGNYCLFIRSYDSFVRWQTIELTEFYFQMGIRLLSSYNDGNILEWADDSLNVLGSVTFNPADQKMSVYIGNQTTKIGTSTVQLQYDRWYLIEFHVILDPSSGSFEFKIDGQSQFTFNGATTPSSTTASWFYLTGEKKDGTLSTSSWYWADDIIINDTTGTSNNSWPNGAKVILLLPTGRGGSTQWEKYAGLDNYYNVSQYPTLDPDKYVYTDHTGKLDLYALQDLSTEVYEIGAVRVDAWALKNSGSEIKLQLSLLTSGLTFTSPDNELGTSYGLIQWLHQLNPGTSVDWSITDINNLQSGIKSNVPE